MSLQLLVLTSCALAVLPHGALIRSTSSSTNHTSNVTVAVVQLQPSSLATTVWKACIGAASWANLAVVPAGVLADPCPASWQQQQAAASQAGGIPIIAACGTSATATVTITDADGAVVHSNSTGSPSVLALKSGTSIAVGTLLGARIWDPLRPRELMLRGAELLVHFPSTTSSSTAGGAAAGGGTSDANITKAMLLTRGFENVAAVLQAAQTGSTLANWCNDMLPPGCSDGSRLLPVQEITVRSLPCPPALPNLLRSPAIPHP